MRMAFVIALFALMTSCAHQPTARVKTDRSLTAEEARIIEIARRVVAANDTWVAHAEFEVPQRRPEGGWGVLVWRLPATPGGFRLITIDETDSVTAYRYGY